MGDINSPAVTEKQLNMEHGDDQTALEDGIEYGGENEQTELPKPEKLETGHNLDSDRSNSQPTDNTTQTPLTTAASDLIQSAVSPDKVKSRYEQANPGIVMKEDPGKKEGARKLRKYLFEQAGKNQAA